MIVTLKEDERECGHRRDGGMNSFDQNKQNKSNGLNSAVIAVYDDDRNNG
jgi:hypothetical protein